MEVDDNVYVELFGVKKKDGDSNWTGSQA
jgi:hypothetical protein